MTSTEMAPPPEAEAEAVPAPGRGFWHDNRVTLVAGAVAVVLTVVISLTMPPSRDLESLWTLLAKLTPFVAAAIAVAWLNVDWARRLRLQLILPPLCFLVFFTYFVPKIFFYANLGADFQMLYYTVLILVPFVILCLALCLRLGGARTSTVLRLAFAMLLLQLSGIEDLAFLVLNLTGPLSERIPEVWTWADHITVRIGHPPTRNEAYAFIVVHVVLAVLVLALPDRAYRAIGGLFRRRTPR